MLFFQECHATITAGGMNYTTRHVYTNSKYFVFNMVAKTRVLTFGVFAVLTTKKLAATHQDNFNGLLISFWPVLSVM